MEGMILKKAVTEAAIRVADLFEDKGTEQENFTVGVSLGDEATQLFDSAVMSDRFQRLIGGVFRLYWQELSATGSLSGSTARFAAAMLHLGWRLHEAFLEHLSGKDKN